VVIPCLIAAIGLCTQNGMDVCKEVQPMFRLHQTPRGK